MAKKIIIFCDGTWNRRERRVNGTLHPTNVVQLMRALKPTDQNHTQQVVYYDQGVGTRGLWDKIVGGLFGVGLSHNIKEAYRFIANNYDDRDEARDEIFLFGFSRGAYTARALSGLIGAVGLLPKRSLEYVPEVYKYYRTRPEKRAFSKHKEIMISQIPESRRHIPIKFIGVWDTVGALGIPVRGLNWISRAWVGFHNTELSGKLNFAYHALAIDEKRRPFAPNLWTKQELPNANQEVMQVWFPGVHSSIGGGYDDPGLSDMALTWMAKRAEDRGLEFDPAYFREKVRPDPSGVLLDSFTLPYRLVSWVPGLRPYRRPIGTIQPAGHGVCPVFREMIHESALQRLNALPDSYAPENLKGAASTVPIFGKRRYIRETGDWLAKLILSEGTRECRMLDYTQDQGAKIKLPQRLSIVSSLELESDLTGRIPARVVWQQQDLAGLQFAKGGGID